MIAASTRLPPPIETVINTPSQRPKRPRVPTRSMYSSFQSIGRSPSAGTQSGRRDFFTTSPVARQVGRIRQAATAVPATPITSQKPEAASAGPCLALINQLVHAEEGIEPEQPFGRCNRQTDPRKQRAQDQHEH